MTEGERVREELREARWWGSDHMGLSAIVRTLVFTLRETERLNDFEQRRICDLTYV